MSSRGSSRGFNMTKLSKLLKQTQHHDKDERFMATSDITTQLESFPGEVDMSMQAPICNAVLAQLDDSSPDVQTVAVKCLSQLVLKVHPRQVVEILQKMGALLVSPRQAQSRDVYTIGLKTIIGALDEESCDESVGVLTSALLKGLKPTKATPEVVQVCTEILTDLLSRFGASPSVQAQHDDILRALSDRLEAPEEQTRKRVTASLGALVTVLGDAPFQKLMELVATRLQHADGKPALLYTYIKCVGVITQAAGARIGAHLPQIVPKLEHFCVLAERDQHLGGGGSEEEADEKLVELWQYSLQAFESILSRCPGEATPYIPAIVRISLDFIQYDPNYTYPDSDDEGEGGDAMQDDGFDDDDDDDGGDGDWGDDGDDDGWDDGFEDEGGMEEGGEDASWKVRRAAVRTLEALVRSRSDLLDAYFDDVSGALVKRFKERDQTVRLAVLGAASSLLLASVTQRQDMSRRGAGGLPQAAHSLSFHGKACDRVGSMITAAKKALGNSAAAAGQQAVLALFRAMLIVKQNTGGLADHLAELLPVVEKALSEDQTALKSDALRLCRYIVDLHPLEVLAPHVGALVKAGTEGVENQYLKLKADSLRLLDSLTTRLGRSRLEYVQQLYLAMYSQLVLKDMDADAKEASITALANLLATYGDKLEAQQLGECLPVLAQRLDNEVTRLPALRALARVAKSPIQVDLSPIAEQSVGVMCGFLRKESQALRHNGAQTLAVVVSSVRARLSTELCIKLLGEVAPLVGDSDLHLSHLVLELASEIVEVHGGRSGSAQEGGVTSVAMEAVLPAVQGLLRSPLLQGEALTSAVRFYTVCLGCIKSGEAYESLVNGLLGLVSADAAHSSCVAVAHCVAALAKSAGPEVAARTVGRFVRDVKAAQGDHAKQQLSLLVLGELGREQDLSQNKEVEEVTFAAFASPSDSVRNAASYTLGNVAVGNMAKYLPLMLEMLASHADQAYLLLSSLKETISRFASGGAADKGGFLPYVERVMPVLIANAASADEGVRNMVAECLGRMASIDAARTLPGMLGLVGSADARVRACVMTALRYSLATASDGSSHSLPPILKEQLPKFLVLLSDADLAVRTQALRTVSALAHAQEELLQGSVLHDTVLPVLYKECKADASLVRVVDLGPFKQKIDDHLPLRKHAYQALRTLLDGSLHLLQLQPYIASVKQGLTDDSDIQILAYGILQALAEAGAPALLDALDSLPKAVLVGVRPKLKEAKSTSDKSLAERAKDVLRATVRAMYAMREMEGAEQSTKFCDFYLRVLKTAILAEMLAEMKAAGQ